MKPYTFLLALLGSLSLFACFNNGNAGNTMETENSVAFTIVLPNGKNAALTSYRIRPTWFLADTSGRNDSASIIQSGITDKNGKILVEGLPLGSYVIEFYNDSLASTITFDHLDTTRPQSRYQVILESYGAVRGRVLLTDSIRYAWVQIYGLNKTVITDSLGNFQIDSLPVGTLRLMAWSPTKKRLLAETDFTTIAGDTLGLGLLQAPSLANENPMDWTYSQTIIPSSLISDWMRPLQFPTVITLYLDDSNFNFDQAKSDGRDLRLFTAANHNLMFNRLRWEPSRGKAVLKIRLEDASDTLETWSFRWGKIQAIDMGHPDVWNGLSDSLVLALNSVLIDNFEGNSARNALPEPIATSYWFITQAESTTVTPNPGPGYNFATALQEAGLGRPGKAVHLTFTANAPWWILLGSGLGEGIHSLSTLDSVEFWLRGNTEFSVAFENNSKDTLGSKAWLHMDADSVWTRIAVKPSDFMPADSIGGNIGWNAVRDSITNISFFATGGSDFWLDDVRLYGISRDDLINRD